MFLNSCVQLSFRWSDWSGTEIIKKNIIDKDSRLFLEAWFTYFDPNSINEAISLPFEYRE